MVLPRLQEVRVRGTPIKPNLVAAFEIKSGERTFLHLHLEFMAVAGFQKHRDHRADEFLGQQFALHSIFCVRAINADLDKIS